MALYQYTEWDGIEFPTQEQVDAAKTVLAEQWGPQVADL